MKIIVWQFAAMLVVAVVLILAGTIGCWRETPPLERANKAFRNGDWAATVALCDEAIQTSPDNAEAYLLRAKAHLVGEQFEKAVADLTQAIERAPDWAEPYYHREIAYRELGEAEKAAADHEDAIARDPNYGKSLTNALVVETFEPGPTRGGASATDEPEAEEEAKTTEGPAVRDLFADALADAEDEVAEDEAAEDPLRPGTSIPDRFNVPRRFLNGRTVDLHRGPNLEPAEEPAATDRAPPSRWLSYPRQMPGTVAPPWIPRPQVGDVTAERRRAAPITTGILPQRYGQSGVAGQNYSSLRPRATYGIPSYGARSGYGGRVVPSTGITSPRRAYSLVPGRNLSPATPGTSMRRSSTGIGVPSGLNAAPNAPQRRQVIPFSRRQPVTTGIQSGRR